MTLSIENAWILGVIYLLVSYVPMLFNKEGAVRLVNFSWMKKSGRMISYVLMVCYFAFIIVTFSLKITENRALFAAGLFLYLLGITGIIVSYANYFTTPQNKLVQNGIYKISRNPIYLSSMLVSLGIVILCKSPALAGLITIYFLLQYQIIIEEERFCAEKYGEIFNDYKKRVPRYFLSL